MLNYQTWLEKPGTVKVLLVQIERTAGTVTEYLSTHTVAVGGQNYQGIVKNSFEINESINTDYAASISYGTVDVVNGNGELDSWLGSSYIWVNKPVRVYVGELPQPGVSASLTNDFELVFDGLIADIDARDRFTLSFKVRDKLEKLNTSLSETLLGNYFNGASNVSTTLYNNQNKNSLRPLCFGEVFNVTPLVADPVYLEYMVNNGSTELIIEVRDNGIPVQFTIGGTVPSGSFRLTRNPAGAITCSLQGIQQTVSTSTGAVSTGYDPSAKNTILAILRGYGKTLQASEIELSSFAGSYATEAVGIYLNDRINVLQLCQDIAKSCGCVLSVTRLGKVKLINLLVPTTASTTIADGDMFLNSLTISRRIDVIAGVKLGSARNYTVQNNLVTAIPQEHKDIFASDYLESVSADSVVKTNYSITTEPSLEQSYLIDSAEADTVATKKLNLFKVGRVVYRMQCTAKFLSVQLGDAVAITSSRFGLSNTPGLVISTKPDWLKGTIELEVLV
jgi:hypothetical protein